MSVVAGSRRAALSLLSLSGSGTQETRHLRSRKGSQVEGDINFEYIYEKIYIYIYIYIIYISFLFDLWGKKT